MSDDIVKEAEGMLMCQGELNECGKWKENALKAKGGTVTHKVPDISRHKKICCDKFMGEKCDCNFTKKGLL